MKQPRRRMGTNCLAVAGAVVALALWLRRVVLPARPSRAPLPIPRRIPDPELRPSLDGAGVRIVVNPTSGPAWVGPVTDELRAALPRADVHELGEGDDLVALLCAGDDVMIGAAGGDGTLSAVAVVAADREIPFVAVPAGTLNHLARDLGLESTGDAIAAVRAGTAARMDLATAGECAFVNTLALGGYSQIVDARERLERRIGKWPALVVALARELPRLAPLSLEIDGQRTEVWLAWIGNCRYSPTGFGPSWRESLDDGLLDVRVVTRTRRGSRTRFVMAVLTGRLSSCKSYAESTARELEIRSLDGPLRLAVDGETIDAPAHLTVTKRHRALLVAVPPADDADQER